MFRLFLSFIILSYLLSCQQVDNPLEALLSNKNLQNASISDGVELIHGDEGKSIELTFPASDKRMSVKIPLPDGPQDWNDVGTFSFYSKSNSTIRYYVAIHNTAKERFGYSVHPYLNVPVQVAITGDYWREKYMNNTQFKAHWLSNWGNHIDLDEVEWIEISMRPNQPVTLELGNFTFHNDEIEDAILSEGPHVDEFGQWIDLDWPEKIHSKKELQEAWINEDEQLKEDLDFGFSEYGGWKEKQLMGSGFFRTVELDDRWWLVDPDGYLFYSMGVNCIRFNGPTQVEGREQLFRQIPPNSGETTDFYRYHAEQRYGKSEFIKNWKQNQNRRLKQWGFNTVANWSSPEMWKEPSTPFVIDLNFNRSGRNWHRFPDVFSEAFEQKITAEALDQCTPYRNEPFLIGYFTGNEERWPMRNFIDLILNDPEPSATQDYVISFFNENGDTPESREKLIEVLARTYFSKVTEAIRKADPNHLILGIRWAGGRAPDPVMRANDVFDVFSLNFYQFQVSQERVEHLHQLTGRPIMIGEFHFGAVDRGYAPSLVTVKDQHERGVAYQYYIEQAAALPMVIGTHYFQHVEQPVTGRFDGENYGFGFVTQQDIPHPLMVQFARETHKRIYPIHLGDIPPTEIQAKVR